MKRLARVLALAAVGVLAPGALAGSAIAAAPVTPAGPEEFALAPPHDAPSSEPAGSASRARVVPGSYGVVLVLNASMDVPARVIAREMAAARGLAARLPQRMPLGIVTYNGIVTVLTQPTTDRRTIASALRKAPSALAGSRVYDATSTAIGLLAPLEAGTVVTLVGAPDSGSRATPAKIAASALAGQTRVLAIGAVPSARPVLDELVSAGAAHSLGLSSAAGLPGAYGSIARQLNRASTIPMASVIAGRMQATLAARAQRHGVRAPTAPHRQAPAKHAAPKRAPQRHAATANAGGAKRHAKPDQTAAKPSASGEHPFFGSTAGRIAAMLGVIGLVFIVLASVLLATRGDSVGKRVAEYAGPTPEKQGAFDATAPAADGAPSHALAEQMGKLAHTLELARIDVSPARIIGFTAGGTLIAALVFGAALHLPLVAIALLIAGPLVTRSVVRFRLKRQRKLFAEQLADSLQSVAGAMRAGHSFTGALSTIVEDAPEPSASEFARVVSDEQLGVPLEQAFEEMVERMQNRDIGQVALVATLQRETGGNGAEALDRVVENLRSQDEVRRLVDTLTAQGKLSRWILTAIPIGLGVALTTLSAEYMRPLYHSGIGVFLLCVACLMVAAGSFAIGKVVDIKV